MTVWVLTDRRYLGQRMPASLIEWLEREGCPPRTIVVDDGARLCSVAPLTKALVPSAWERLEPGDLVVTRSRDVFALALLEEAEARDARTLDSAQAVHRVRHKASCALGLARRGLPIPRNTVTYHVNMGLDPTLPGDLGTRKTHAVKR